MWHVCRMFSRHLEMTRELMPIAVDGMTVPCRLRRSARARRIRITVRGDGVELVVPVRGSLRDGEAFLRVQRNWIETRVRAVRAALSQHPGTPRLQDGSQVWLRGAPMTLRLEPRSGLRRARFTSTAEELRIQLPMSAAGPDDELLVGFLEGWLRAQAKADAFAHVERHGPPNGLVPRTIRIKEQRRLWGSCSGQGGVNLNWRLILAPPEIFEYVVVHELCHLEHPHHQPPFWRRVAELLPDYGVKRRWLKQHGHLLTLRPGDQV